MSEPLYKVGDTVLVSLPKIGKKQLTIDHVYASHFGSESAYDTQGFYIFESRVEGYASQPVEDEPVTISAGDPIDLDVIERLGATLTHVPDVPPVVPDVVNHPAHYTAYPVEVIQLTEHLNFCRGNAVKYVARAGLKNPDTEVQDLEKAVWYLNREIQRIKETPNGR